MIVRFTLFGTKAGLPMVDDVVEFRLLIDVKHESFAVTSEEQISCLELDRAEVGLKQTAFGVSDGEKQRVQMGRRREK